MTQTIEQLTARVRELEADLAAARQIIDEENKDHIEQLAASQAYAGQLREACAIAEKTIDIVWVSHHANRCDHALELCRKALSQPTSTEALDTYIEQKMRACRELDAKQIAYLFEERSLLIRQRDLAVEALEKTRNWFESERKSISKR